jgi:hypothetical protein
MMEITNLATFLQSMVCLAVLGLLLLKLWSAARLDAFRQEMFTVRDELFDYAAEGKITFNSPAYRLLRQMLNGFIRYGHQLTFFRVAMTALEIKLVDPRFSPAWSDNWEKALGEITDKNVQEHLKGLHDRAMNCVTERVVTGSPFLLILAAFAILFLLLREGWDNLKQIFAAAPTFTLSRIVDTRIIESQAAAAAIA